VYLSNFIALEICDIGIKVVFALFIYFKAYFHPRMHRS